MSEKKSVITKRVIQISLGILWLVDAMLQFQHQMFTRAFANSVIAPNAVGQPPVIYGPIHFEVHLLVLHPAIFNLAFALTQLLLGVLLLFKRTARTGLITSVFWVLGVWFFGEGLGGLLGGSSTLWMGAPGAVIFYGILALAVLPSRKYKNTVERPAYWLPIVWAIAWIGGSLLQLQPNQRSTEAVSSMVSGMSDGAPGWLASLDMHTANFINGHGFSFIVFLLAVQVIIGALVFFPGALRKLAVWFGILMALSIWLFGENLGEFYTGRATDPNSGPLLILLGVAVLGCSNYDFRKLWQKTWSDLEHLIT